VEYGDERDPQMREFFEKIAPINNIEKIKKPMLVIAGKNDPRVPVSESQQFADELKKQGTPVRLLIAKDEGHGYRKKLNQDFQFYATVEFIQEYPLKLLCLLAAQRDLDLKMKAMRDASWHHLHTIQPRRIKQHLQELVHGDGIHDVADGETARDWCPVRGHRERRDSILVFQTDDDADEIIEILLLEATELQAIKQVIIQRKLTDSSGHAIPLQGKVVAGLRGRPGGGPLTK
jgi:hypothetical protein